MVILLRQPWKTCRHTSLACSFSVMNPSPSLLIPGSESFSPRGPPTQSCSWMPIQTPVNVCPGEKRSTETTRSNVEGEDDVRANMMNGRVSWRVLARFCIRQCLSSLERPLQECFKLRERRELAHLDIATETGSIHHGKSFVASCPQL